VLQAVVGAHLESFLAAVSAGGDGHGLPPFVEREFHDFLGCGVLARGFARVRCAACAFERLVPFSCKVSWAGGPQCRNEKWSTVDGGAS
jgi:hypothetical protein